MDLCHSKALPSYILHADILVNTDEALFNEGARKDGDGEAMARGARRMSKESWGDELPPSVRSCFAGGRTSGEATLPI